MRGAKGSTAQGEAQRENESAEKGMGEEGECVLSFSLHLPQQLIHEAILLTSTWRSACRPPHDPTNELTDDLGG